MRYFSLLLILTFFLSPAQALAQENTQPANDKTMPVREMTEEKKVDFKAEMQQKRQEALTKSKTQRDSFKTRLNTITDERKQMLVEKIDTKIVQINTNSTEKMADALTRLSSLLDKVASHAGTSTPSAQTSQAVANAQEDIETAQTAVSLQSSKTYVLQWNSEATLRNNVGQTINLLQQDLRTTHQTVKDAKTAVIEAIKTLNQNLGQDIKKDLEASTGAN